MEAPSYGPDHPFHMGYTIGVRLPKGTSEEDALIALGIVREQFPEAKLMETRATGWDVSSTSATVEVEA